jgi:hypothetical protein
VVLTGCRLGLLRREPFWHQHPVVHCVDGSVCQSFMARFRAAVLSQPEAAKDHDLASIESHACMPAAHDLG